MRIRYSFNRYEVEPPAPTQDLYIALKACDTKEFRRIIKGKKSEQISDRSTASQNVFHPFGVYASQKSWIDAARKHECIMLRAERLAKKSECYTDFCRGYDVVYRPNFKPFLVMTGFAIAGTVLVVVAFKLFEN